MIREITTVGLVLMAAGLLWVSYAVQRGSARGDRMAQLDDSHMSTAATLWAFILLAIAGLVGKGAIP